MKSIFHKQILCIWLLIIGMSDCKADDSVFEVTTAVSYSTVYYGTSSNKFYSAENEFQAVQFAQLNWQRLLSDMANGQGEYLSAMADLLGIHSAQKSNFYKMSQSKFSQLLPSAETTPQQLVHHLKIEIRKLGSV